MNILNVFSTEGRLTKSEFWKLFWPKLLIFLIILLSFGGCLYISETTHFLYSTYFFLTVAALGLYFFYGVSCKRLHDIGKGATTFWVGYIACIYSIRNLVIYLAYDYVVCTFPIYVRPCFPEDVIFPTIISCFFFCYFFRNTRPEQKGLSEENSNTLPIKNILSPSLCYIGISICAALIVLPYCVTQVFDHDSYVLFFVHKCFYDGGLFVLLVLFTAFTYLNARRHGYTLFYTFGILFTALAALPLEWLTQLISTGLCIYSAFIFTGILRSKSEAARPLGHIIMCALALFAATVILAYSGSPTFAEICTYIAIIQSLRYCYEYLRHNKKQSKIVSIAVAFAVTFAIYCATMLTIVHIQYNVMMHEYPILMQEITEPYPYIGDLRSFFLYAQNKMMLYYRLIFILIIAGIIFTPQFCRLTQNEHTASRRLTRPVRYCYISIAVLLIITAVWSFKAFNEQDLNKILENNNTCNQGASDYAYACQQKTAEGVDYIPQEPCEINYAEIFPEPAPNEASYQTQQ